MHGLLLPVASVLKYLILKPNLLPDLYLTKNMFNPERTDHTNWMPFT